MFETLVKEALIAAGRLHNPDVAANRHAHEETLNLVDYRHEALLRRLLIVPNTPDDAKITITMTARKWRDLATTLLEMADRRV